MQHGENAIVLCSELLSRLLALLHWALHIHWNKAARRGIRGRRELWKQFTAKVRTWLMGAQRLSDLVGCKGCVLDYALDLLSQRKLAPSVGFPS
jgi:hypothetical protein